ncbi:glycosyltransferase [Conchiformibius steedae]|uniref:Glycosyltransferase n=1 Tax=Conchiformibius steedae TaxID=153493 RepID=A0A3P2A8J2_9NEIS|nr:glycosyltransferase [Conchiformibius steedae]RRD91305.1 glycosyltransferase [Conchiformibius steedae]
MKILYVITGLGLGGAEKCVLSLAEAMCQRGHDVKIAYLTGKVVLKPKYTEIDLISLKPHSFRHIFCSFYKYLKLIESFRPDVVHSHMVHANIFARIGRLFKPIPKLISTAHSSNEGGRFRMLAYRLTHNLSDITTNVSQQAVLEFENRGAVPKHGMVVVYNGIDIEKFSVIKPFNKREYLELLGLDTNKKVLLAVGRLEEPKDYPNLIQALELIKRKEIYNWQMVIVGSGTLKNEIETLIQSLGLAQEIKLIGMRYDISELMNIADIYVLSSKFEGLPTVLIEAMACEKFIVATDCGGITEILGSTGILVPPQNYIYLAKAIERALNLSEQEVYENGKYARNRVKKLFSSESYIKNWLELYEYK